MEFKITPNLKDNSLLQSSANKNFILSCVGVNALLEKYESSYEKLHTSKDYWQAQLFLCKLRIVCTRLFEFCNLL